MARTTPYADYCLRMAAYSDAAAHAHRLFSEAAAVDPIESGDQRERRAKAALGLAGSYEESARRYREMAEDEAKPAVAAEER